MNETKKKWSAMSVWALILSLLGCTSLIGLILAIVDLASGDDAKKHTGSKVAIGLAILGMIGFIGILGMFGGDEEKNRAEDTSIESTIETPDESTQKNVTPSDTEEAETTEQEPVEPQAEAQSDVPTEYLSALRKAETYSDMMHMSKVGIYEQLISEYGDQFTEEAATYAMENLVADWNENALEKAYNYAETMYMSKAGIYDQLISEYGEKFTEEEAQYAIDNIQVDWKENALKKAQSYQETMAMSPSAIYDQLISEYGEKFTAEEAQYAIDNLN